ncbi:hypothetical protein HYZ78_01250 [Candidatus Microgenomates bacterium]|nr:hypothetical protein [Candidatus Microgenomates bacterium]
MDDKAVKLLEDIKKLHVLTLIKQGVQSKEIAEAFGVDPAIISRMISRRKKE